jgi:spore germination cell wall hydrolase CwlJ-like protein
MANDKTVEKKPATDKDNDVKMENAEAAKKSAATPGGKKDDKAKEEEELVSAGYTQREWMCLTALPYIQV